MKDVNISKRRYYSSGHNDNEIMPGNSGINVLLKN